MWWSQRRMIGRLARRPSGEATAWELARSRTVPQGRWMTAPQERWVTTPQERWVTVNGDRDRSRWHSYDDVQGRATRWHSLPVSADTAKDNPTLARQLTPGVVLVLREVDYCHGDGELCLRLTGVGQDLTTVPMLEWVDVTGTRLDFDGGDADTCAVLARVSSLSAALRRGQRLP